MRSKQPVAKSKGPSSATTKKSQAGGAREEKCEICGACQEAKATHKASTCVFGTIAKGRQGPVSAEPTAAASKAAQE